MFQQRRILLDNAYSAWGKAIKSCEAILDGRVTLSTRKEFVSSLHNAVELFFKQIMLDKGDFRVAEVRNCTQDGYPAKLYFASKNLNDYFVSLDKKTRDKFKSIEFNRICDIHKEILSEYLPSEKSFLQPLRLLNNLRNNETHFYIGRGEYLAEEEFLTLYNYMVDFYRILVKYGLLPNEEDACFELERLGFEREYLTEFSYRTTIKSSMFTERLSQKANGLRFQDYIPGTAFEIADEILSRVDDRYYPYFDQLWECIEVLLEYNMLTVELAETIHITGSTCDLDDKAMEAISEIYELRFSI